MMKFRPIPTIAKLDGWPINGVEVDIIFAHELIKLYILRVKPPFLPFWCEIRCDAWVANRCIKLDSDEWITNPNQSAVTYPDVCKCCQPSNAKGESQ